MTYIKSARLYIGGLCAPRHIWALTVATLSTACIVSLRRNLLHLFLLSRSSFNRDNLYLHTSDGPIRTPTLLKFSVKGELVAAWGGDVFYLPHGLTIDSTGSFWVTDVAMHQVRSHGPHVIVYPHCHASGEVTWSSCDSVSTLPYINYFFRFGGGFWALWFFCVPYVCTMNMSYVVSTHGRLIGDTLHTLLKMSCYSSITMCQYWDNWLIY